MSYWRPKKTRKNQTFAAKKSKGWKSMILQIDPETHAQFRLFAFLTGRTFAHVVGQAVRFYSKHIAKEIEAMNEEKKETRTLVREASYELDVEWLRYQEEEDTE